MEHEEGAPTIEDLPFEVVEKILMYMPKSSVLKMTSVSRQFRDVTINSIRLMDRVTFNWNRFDKDGIVKQFMENKRKYKKLELWDVMLKTQGTTILEFIENNKSTLAKLTLNGNGYTSEFIQKVMGAIPYLEYNVYK